MPDLTIRSVTIAEVIDDDGDRFVTYTTEGDPADWDVLGLIEWAAAVIRNRAGFEDDE